MYISSVSSANFSGINRNSKDSSFNKTNTPNTVSKNNVNSYQLPGYNVSFGALIKSYDKNPGVMLDREQRKVLDDEIQDIIKYEGTKSTEIKENMTALFEKYQDNKAAMQYILVRGINKPVTKKSKFTGKDETVYEPYMDYVKTYLDTVNSYFGDNPRKRRQYLRTALFTKNLNGNTLAHATLRPAGPTSAGLLSVIFDETMKDPDIQVKILKDARKTKFGDKEITETIGERMAKVLPGTEDGEIINDALYRLCAQTRAINRKDSIDLLIENQGVLDKQNKEVLEALQSNDCICVDNTRKKTAEPKDTKVVQMYPNNTKDKTVKNASSPATKQDNSPSIRFENFAMEG